jgi:hypothetical protein
MGSSESTVMGCKWSGVGACGPSPKLPINAYLVFRAVTSCKGDSGAERDQEHNTDAGDSDTREDALLSLYFGRASYAAQLSACPARQCYAKHFHLMCCRDHLSSWQHPCTT